LVRIAARAGAPFAKDFPDKELLRGDGLDAGEAHLAAVLQAKAARIDDGRDAAFALRFEAAVCGIGWTRGGGKQHDCAERDPRPAPESKFELLPICASRHAHTNDCSA
jgi:hypothetical protein